MSQFLETLINLQGRQIFLSTEPEILDFTNPSKPANLIIRENKENLKITIPLSIEIEELKKLKGLLEEYINQAEIIFAWDVKEIFSYFLGRTGCSFYLNNSIFDLKIAERYIGVVNPCPGDLKQVLVRFKGIIDNDWKPYKKIYLPLITSVLPKIESKGLIDQKSRKRLHPHYDVTGTVNGRMKCKKSFTFGFNPHTMSPDDKNRLKTIGFEDVFLSFDYKNMEVSVLQWLSKDELLGEILGSGKDVYEEIWKSITGMECNSLFRQKCKDIFLKKQ